MSEKLIGKNVRDTTLGGVITIDTNNDKVTINDDLCVNGIMGIGTTEPSTNLHIHRANASGGDFIHLTNDDTGQVNTDGSRIGMDSSENLYIFQNEDANMRFGTNNTERMVIDNVGRIAMGSVINTTVQLLVEADSDDIAFRCYRPVAVTTNDVLQVNSDVGGTDTVVFIVEADGDAFNINNSYGMISDVKYKENIVDCNSQWEDIKSMRFRNYNMINTPELTHLGVVAQELEETSPSLITNKTKKVKTGKKVKDKDGNDIDEEIDEEYKCVKASILYMKCAKALQEALIRIEALENK